MAYSEASLASISTFASRRQRVRLDKDVLPSIKDVY